MEENEEEGVRDGQEAAKDNVLLHTDDVIKWKSADGANT